MSAGVMLIGCISDSNPALLRHFLKHHLELGVDEIHLLLHSARLDARSRDEALAVIAEFPVTSCFDWVGAYSASEKDRYFEELRIRYAAGRGWFVPADMDEFRVLNSISLGEVVAQCRKEGHRYVQGFFVDRVGTGGSLPPIKESPSIWEQFPIECRVTELIAGACHGKVAVASGDVPLCKGQHWPELERLEYWRTFESPMKLEVHHFKWDSTITERLKHRVLSYRQKGFEWYIESERILAFLEEHGGFPPDHPLVGARPRDRTSQNFPER